MHLQAIHTQQMDCLIPATPVMFCSHVKAHMSRDQTTAAHIQCLDGFSLGMIK